MISLSAYISGDEEAKIKDSSNKILYDQIIASLGLINIDMRLSSKVKKFFNIKSCERVLSEKVARDDFDVFIAYDSMDKNNILQICQSLRARGIYPWIDFEQIPPGRWFQDIIQSAIRKVKSAAIFIGKNGIGNWQAVELRSFISQCVERDLPVILDKNNKLLDT